MIKTEKLSVIQKLTINRMTQAKYFKKKVALLVPDYYNWDGVSNVVKDHIKGIFRHSDIWVYAFRGDIKPERYNIHYFGDVHNPTIRRIYRLFFPIIYPFLNFIHKAKNYGRGYEEYFADRDYVISFLYPMDTFAVKWRKKYG